VRGVLKYLDISNNNIGSAGFLKLASRLKKSQTLQCLNISSNNLTEKANQFQQLENLLAKTKSLLNFNLSNCSLQADTIKFLARGMSENSSVVKLILSENS
jgi:Ran GTPase-activating protein (RanGAP) involved in mRNA processing and transport